MYFSIREHFQYWHWRLHGGETMIEAVGWGLASREDAVAAIERFKQDLAKAPVQ